MMNELVFYCHGCGATDRISYPESDARRAGDALFRSLNEQRWRLRPGSGHELWCGACAYEYASARVASSELTAELFQERRRSMQEA